MPSRTRSARPARKPKSLYDLCAKYGGKLFKATSAELRAARKLIPYWENPIGAAIKAMRQYDRDTNHV